MNLKNILIASSISYFTLISSVFAQSQLGNISVNETTRCASTSIGQLCDGDIISSQLLSIPYDDTLTNNVALGIVVNGNWAGENTFTQGIAQSNGYEVNPNHFPATTTVHVITKQDADNPIGNTLLKNGSIRDFSGNTNQLIIVSKDVGMLAYFGGIGTTTINSDENSATVLVGENNLTNTFARINFNNNLFVTGKVLILDAVSLESSKEISSIQPMVKLQHEGYAQSLILMNGRSLIDLTFGIQGQTRGCGQSAWNTCYSPGSAIPFYKNITFKNAYALDMGYKTDVGYSHIAGISTPALSVNIHNSIIKTTGRGMDSNPWRLDDGTTITQLRNSIIYGSSSNGNLNMLYGRGPLVIKNLNQSIYKSYISNFTNITISSGPDTESPIIFNNNSVSLNGSDGKSYKNPFIFNNTTVAYSVPIYSSLLFNNGNQNTFPVDGSNRMTALNSFYSYNFNSSPGFLSNYPSCLSNRTAIGMNNMNCDMSFLSRNFISIGITP